MEGPSGLEERLQLHWKDDEVQGTLPRRGSLDSVDGFVDTAFNLFVLFIAGVVLPAAMTRLMIETGIGGWTFPAAVASLFMAGILAMGVYLGWRMVERGMQHLFGVTPWRFRVSSTHVEWWGVKARGVGFERMGDRVRLPLHDIETIEPGAPGLQIELLDGAILLLDVDPIVASEDLEALCAFIRHRIVVAQQHLEGQHATTAEARVALGPLPRQAKRQAVS
ncbi:MAG: hypothetical protein AAGA48_07920 [Myxococcota bacterium]